MIKFVKTSNDKDSSELYDVILDTTYTIGEFISWVLLNDIKAGHINFYIQSHWYCCADRLASYEYYDGQLLAVLSNECKKIKIKDVRARGNCNFMDYHIYLEPTIISDSVINLKDAIISNKKG